VEDITEDSLDCDEESVDSTVDSSDQVVNELAANNVSRDVVESGGNILRRVNQPLGDNSSSA
jgi:hypothetical protein